LPRTADGPVQDKGTVIIADKYAPRRTARRVRITANLTAQSADANEVVAAWSSTANERPASGPTRQSQRLCVSVGHCRRDVAEPLDIELRAGPGRPGTPDQRRRSKRHAAPQ
jgi:hypothetical protein